MAKKYYWLKLMKDFFQQPKIKKLRRVAGGDTYTVIYLKLQLLSLENGGKLYFEGVEETFVEEIALTIDEDEDNVRFTLMYLEQQGLLEKIEDHEYAMPEAMARIGSESESAERMRQLRERRKAAEALPSAPSIPALSQCDADVRTSDTEKDIDKDVDLDAYVETEPRGRSRDIEQNAREARGDDSLSLAAPSLEEVEAYCKERGNAVDAQFFHDYYTARDWKSGNVLIKDWKAQVRVWEKDKRNQPAQDQRSRAESEAEHAKGGNESGIGW